jgi:hypothetical protein
MEHPIINENTKNRYTTPEVRQALSHNVVSSTPRHERGSNSQLYWQYYIGTNYTGTVVVNPTTMRSRPQRPAYHWMVKNE